MESATVYFDWLPAPLTALTWVTVPDQVPAMAGPEACRVLGGGAGRSSVVGGICCAVAGEIC
jgi:hypothetical protein